MLVLRFIIYVCLFLFIPGKYSEYFLFFALLLWEIISSKKEGKSREQGAKRAFIFSFLVGLTWFMVAVLAHPSDISALVVILAVLKYSLIGCFFGLFGWGIARIYWSSFSSGRTIAQRAAGVAGMLAIAAIFLAIALKLYKTW
jgi:hypothetical protein